MAQFHPFRESPTLKSYREMLGVTEMATNEELKKAYHKLALLYHPDRNPDPQAPEQFQKIREAFECLSDPQSVQQLEQNHLKEKLHDLCVSGIEIRFGSFFGFRSFVTENATVPRARRLGVDRPSDSDSPQSAFVYVENDKSILDDPAFDSIEVVFAGKFKSDDEDRLNAGLRMTSHSQLPWVVLNNKGILEFLNAHYEKSLKCYEELNQRIPNNIIFMYREALCHIVLAFRNPQRSFFGRSIPNKKSIRRAVLLLKKCIQIGANRPVGKQKCLVIRKVLADVLEHSGRRRSSSQIWKEIRQMSPKSVEAHAKCGQHQEAEALLKRRAQKNLASHHAHRALLKAKP